ncbi:LOW QUALITY PROTEIN: hypothetical protein OSB04_011854 [Centaurea solstitialis]|uniref:Reverse transcriptase Ty1/copia-type domain-containing protein n=1 Tax=Centaurea solstitialis TaxID=347529 RepID=A0AA38WLW7_9ASTR|nr:LOW QUALITY PROTEIN: hypothetical protein OSB04_011854 [Centaurea solstitialis]
MDNKSSPSQIIESPSEPVKTISATTENKNSRETWFWRLVVRPRGKSIIDLKWIFRNKKDENGLVICNKAKLVAKGYRQQEGIDYDDTFAPLAWLETIWIFLAYATHKNMKVYQRNIKCTFLNGVLQEQVYVEEPKGFVDLRFPEHVYVLDKAIYGLKQASRAWYETLTIHLLESGYKKGTDCKSDNARDLSQLKHQCLRWFNWMLTYLLVDRKNYRAIIGSLLYLTASRPDIVFLHCDSKDSHLTTIKRILRYLKGTPDFGLWYPKDSGLELISYLNEKKPPSSSSFLLETYFEREERQGSDILYSIGGGDHQLKLAKYSRLLSVPHPRIRERHTLDCSDQNSSAMSCCSQVLWMKTQLADCGYTMRRISIYCDSKSFIKDHVEKGNIELYFVESEHQLVGLFAKPFNEKSHFYLLSKLGMLDLPDEFMDGITTSDQLRSELAQNHVSRSWDSRTFSSKPKFDPDFPNADSVLCVQFDSDLALPAYILLEMADQRKNPPSPIDEVADELLSPIASRVLIIKKNAYISFATFLTEH